MRSKRKIWLLQRSESLPIASGARRMRTAMMADALLERGHSVVWWTSAFDHFEKKWRFDKDTEVCVNKNFTLKVLKGIGYKKNISLPRLIDQRIVAKKFRRFAYEMQKPDIIIASLPSHDLAYEAVSYGKNKSVPVLVDIRDPWPDLFLDHIPNSLKRMARLMLWKDFNYVKKTMKMTDGIIAVTDTFLDWGLKYACRCKRKKDRVFYLGAKRVAQEDRQGGSSDTFKGKFVVLFIGTFSHYHNPSILLDCAKMFKNTNVHFVIAGDGQFFEEIEERASKISNVTLTGWVEDKDIKELLEIADVGVCPSRENSNLFPNKAFSYFSFGLPVISSFEGDLREIIEKDEIGLNYRAGDVEDLVACLQKLYDNPDYLRVMSQKATRVFEEKFNSDMIYEQYADHIEDVLMELGGGDGSNENN